MPLGEKAELSLRGLLAAAGLATGTNRGEALRELITRVPRVVAGVEKACKSFLLILTEDRGTDGRRDDKHQNAQRGDHAADGREVPPGDAREEQDHERDH